MNVNETKAGAPTYEADVTSRKHVQFIERHAPLPRAAPSTRRRRAGDPPVPHALAAVGGRPLLARHHVMTEDMFVPPCGSLYFIETSINHQSRSYRL
ncbi:hypothetical protein predicted by Glimmer/Critica [Sorangium cellulosum So ce56]|uniref:Uncharacterized protein n=1 Tax=Sorangium cellulosum (strain So ce56) TaxID=448385 RepID=A9F4N9_SORC5|nr:hypothetical protein predicted by Glimmer/Critica [Sorangium cellulosum So ce56]